MADPGTALATSKPVIQGLLTAAPTVAKIAGGVLGGPVGAAIGGLAGQYVAGKLDPAAKAMRQQQAKDIAALQSGKLGLSEAEKRTMLAGAARGLQAQTAGIEANLRRQAAAQGGFGQSGAQQRAIGKLASQRGEQLSQYAGKVDELSQQTAERRKDEIMNRLERRRAEALQAGAQAGQAAFQLPAEIGVAAQKVKGAETAKQGGQADQLLEAFKTLAGAYGQGGTK